MMILLSRASCVLRSLSARFVAFFLLVGIASASLAQTADQYFPTDLGSTWTYDTYASPTATAASGTVNVVAIGYAGGTINGVVPIVFTSGAYEYDAFSKSGDQVQYHGFSYTGTGSNGVSNITQIAISPPIYFNNIGTVGTTWAGSGTVSGYVAGVGPFSGSYSASTSIDGMETVTTSAGTFSTIKVSYSRTIVVAGMQNWTTTSSYWIAKGIGIVKSQSSTGYTTILSNSNRLKTVSIGAGWNLIGNSLQRPVTVSEVFNNQNYFTTVWKWNPGNASWAFYAPSMTSTALQTYAAGKGYSVLDQIGSGEGFWVNAQTSTTAVLK